MDARVQMSLHTLKKLFNEYTHPKEPLSEQERDMKLYQMLPLFCKVSTDVVVVVVVVEYKVHLLLTQLKMYVRVNGKVISTVCVPRFICVPKHTLTYVFIMFCLCSQVFSACPASDMSEKFWDVVAFCQQVSRLMVGEIRKRASNQSTEAASIAIVKFLEIETTEETSSGWMLLSTLNLLANGDVSLIQVSARSINIDKE